MKNTIIKNRFFAKITGYSLLAMAVIAGFAFGFAFPKIVNPNQFDAVQSNLASNLPLYKWMLVAILVVLLLDLLVSWTLFKYFKSDNRKLALLATSMRIVYTVVFGTAAFFLAKNAWNPATSNEIISTNFQLFQAIWSVGLILFGIHLIFVGMLMKLHSRIPTILWFLTLFAGASYVVVHILKLTPTQADIVTNLEMVLALPMAIGELGLAIWLLVKGGKAHNKNRASTEGIFEAHVGRL